MAKSDSKDELRPAVVLHALTEERRRDLGSYGCGRRRFFY